MSTAASLDICPQASEEYMNISSLTTVDSNQVIWLDERPEWIYCKLDNSTGTLNHMYHSTSQCYMNI